MRDFSATVDRVIALLDPDSDAALVRLLERAKGRSVFRAPEAIGASWVEATDYLTKLVAEDHPRFMEIRAVWNDEPAKSSKPTILTLGIVLENDSDEPIVDNAEIARCGPFYAVIVANSREAMRAVTDLFPLYCSTVPDRPE